MSTNKTIDLHVHTNYSDGTDSPSAIVERAARLGLVAIAITDHDTIAGVSEGIEQGDKSGVEVLTGVELSAVADHNRSIHILGYGLRIDRPELLTSLEKIQTARDQRNRDIIEKLQDMGIAIDMDELQICSCQGQAGRPHLARLLHQKRVVNNQEEAFPLYLGKDAAAYVPRKTLSVRDAIGIIRQAGGIAVLAHPMTVASDWEDLAGLISEFKNDGLAGIEAYYHNHNPDIQEKLLDLSRGFSLLITGGSDFHGKNKPNIRMGRTSNNRTIPYSILDTLKEKLTE